MHFFLCVGQWKRTPHHFTVNADSADRSLAAAGMPVVSYSRAAMGCAACRVDEGTVDTILSYCHNSLNDTSLLDLVPYLQSKGVGIISASPMSMGLLTTKVAGYTASALSPAPFSVGK